MEGAEGVTVMLRKTGVTARVADPLIVPEVALIVVVPADNADAKPVALTLATTVLEDFQVTKFVMFEVTPPLKVPVAVNCCWDPVLIDALDGVTAIADSPERFPLPLSDTD